MCPENLFKAHARKYLEKHYPHYCINFEEGKLNRVVSTFHAYRQDDHILGEVHCVPQNSLRSMQQSLDRLKHQAHTLGIDTENATALIFSPRDIGGLARIRDRQEAFGRENGVHFVVMPTKQVFQKRLKRLRKNKKKAKQLISGNQGKEASIKK